MGRQISAGQCAQSLAGASPREGAGDDGFALRMLAKVLMAEAEPVFADSLWLDQAAGEVRDLRYRQGATPAADHGKRLR